MTETSTKTWYELEQLVRHCEAAIENALADYRRGVSIHTIMERLEAAKNESSKLP